MSTYESDEPKIRTRTARPRSTRARAHPPTSLPKGWKIFGVPPAVAREREREEHIELEDALVGRTDPDMAIPLEGHAAEAAFYVLGRAAPVGDA